MRVLLTICCLFSTLGYLVAGHQDSIPHRTNVVFIVDTHASESHLTQELVSQVLDTIPLKKYRIGIYSTNGLSQKILEFQTRQCSGRVFRKTKHRVSVNKVLSAVYKDLTYFRKDRNVLVALTSRRSSIHLRKSLDHLARRLQRNEAKYVIQLKKYLSGKVKSLLWKSTGHSWRHTNFLSHGVRNLLKRIYGLFHFTKVNLLSCTNPSKARYVYDECNRQCQCVNGKLVNCYRVRKQFSALPLSERLHYIRTYKFAANDKRFQKKFYEIVIVHPTVNFDRLHSPEELFPFHRKYALMMENLLRQVDCRITLPFWNFALHSKHIYQRYPGYHMWDAHGGFGSTKTNLKGKFCIKDGPFRWPVFKLPQFFVNKINNTERRNGACPDTNAKIYQKCDRKLRKVFNPRCILRSVSHNEKTPSYEKTYRILHDPKTTFEKFEEFIRADCHASVHDNLGGDFGYGFSSLLPEFFLLHSMIDGLWAFYQKRFPKHSKKWLHDKKRRIVGYHTPRFWYVDIHNIERCGLKIKYTNLFPKKVNMKKIHHHHHQHHKFKYHNGGNSYDMSDQILSEGLEDNLYDGEQDYMNKEDLNQDLFDDFD
ncbi:uncharacterized protein [Clytia hemisphaerica]|uniref:Tyrosinase copper-binding domain-containing protein n=1 Tax=Clytia hemisphaerica TaxID=252671 RepID=A0A7M6DQ32_9CNID